MEAYFARLEPLCAAHGREHVVTLSRAVLAAIGAQLTASDWRALLGAVPASIRGGLERDPSLYPASSPHEVAERVGGACALPLGRALEEAEMVCRAIAEALPEDTRAQLLRHLPDGLAQLFAPAAPEHAPLRPAHAHFEPAPRATLATGHSGSERPLSEAVPDRAQAGSVARFDPARTEKTLGGFAGDPRESEAETLATGKPGSKRPLGDAER
jgi:hypothetical protein